MLPIYLVAGAWVVLILVSWLAIEIQLTNIQATLKDIEKRLMPKQSTPADFQPADFQPPATPEEKRAQEEVVTKAFDRLANEQPVDQRSAWEWKVETEPVRVVVPLSLPVIRERQLAYEDFLNTLALHVKALAEEDGSTEWEAQAKLSLKLGFDNQYIQRILNRKRRPSVAAATIILDALNIPKSNVRREALLSGLRARKS